MGAYDFFGVDRSVQLLLSGILGLLAVSVESLLNRGFYCVHAGGEHAWNLCFG